MPWSRRFDEPTNCRPKLRTLKDAIAWLAKRGPAGRTRMKQVQAAAHCVTEARREQRPE